MAFAHNKTSPEFEGYHLGDPSDRSNSSYANSDSASNSDSVSDSESASDGEANTEEHESVMQSIEVFVAESASIEDNAAVEDPDYLPQGAESKPKKKTSGKKPKKKQGTWVADYANVTKPYSKTTFVNRIGIVGMKRFLTQAPFNIDVEAEYPEDAKLAYYGSDGDLQTRGQAMADKCRELQQLLIDARKSREEEEATRQMEGEQFVRGDGTSLAHSVYTSLPHWPGSLPHSALVPDSDLTANARLDLQSIRRRVEAQIEAFEEPNQEISEDGFEYVLDSNEQPLFSVSVQQLIYSIVDTAIRGRQLRSLQVSESGDRRFQVATEYIELRFMLRYELEATLDLEEGVDRSAIAQKLVVEEFPLD